MKLRFAGLVASAAVAVSTLGVLASPAIAADTPGCVTENEYFTVYSHQTVAKVADHFDTAGTLLASYSGANGFDTVRSYRKCQGFDGGRGRVGVNFDNYSAQNVGYYDGKMRLWSKARNNPWNLVWW